MRGKLALWNARQTQLVWFANQPIDVSATEAFEVFSDGVKPTSTSTQQIPNANAFLGQQQFLGSTEQANGQVDKYIITAKKHLNRLDIIVQPVVTQQSIKSAPLLQNFDKVLDLLNKQKEALSKLVKSASRVACVTNFVLEKPSLADANKKVLDTIGIEANVLKQGTDLSFSINRRVDIKGKTYNRTFRLQVEQFINLTVATPNNQLAGGVAPIQSPPIYAAAMMFDMNTPLPNAKPYNAASQVVLLDEMLRATAAVRKLDSLNELGQ